MSHVSKQIMKPLVMGMSTTNLQASWALASNQDPDGFLGKIVQFMWHVKQQAVQVPLQISLASLKPTIGLLTVTEAIHWNNIISNFGNFHAQNFIGDVFKFYEFLFWLSVYNSSVQILPSMCFWLHICRTCVCSNKAAPARADGKLASTGECVIMIDASMR